MLISRSLGRKLGATAIVAVAFVLMYEAKVMDFRYIAMPGSAQEADPDDLPLTARASHLRFSATAYCKGTTTASGVNVRTGIAAADPDLLPVGSVIQVYKLGEQYNGIYTIMDTGPAVQGRHVDIYIWSCNEALRFGRQPVRMTVLRLGWNPHATTRGFFDRMLSKPPAVTGPEPLPSRSFPTEQPPALR